MALMKSRRIYCLLSSQSYPYYDDGYLLIGRRWCLSVSLSAMQIPNFQITEGEIIFVVGY